MQARFAFGAVAGHPGRHGRTGDTELRGHMGLGNTVAEMTVHHT